MTELSLHILDLVENSLSAGASKIDILVSEDPSIDLYRMEIHDNGKGMDKRALKKVTDPFFTTRTTRKVGLGVPLFKQAIEQCNGNLLIDSLPGEGLRLIACMQFSHFDRQPLGDIAGVMVQLVSSFPGTEFRYEHVTPKGSYIFDSSEVKSIIGIDHITDPKIIRFIRQMIRENLEDIGYSI